MDILLALQLFYDALLLLCCGCAFFYGGGDEKLVALALLIASATSAIIAAWPGFSWRQGHQLIMIVDIGFFAALGYFASISRRFWPLWATAFQLIDLATHALMIAAPHRILAAYVMLQGFWAYPILLTIALGTRAHRRRALQKTSAP